MKSEKLHFRGSLGETLAARIDWPDEDVRAYALFAHCFTCTSSLKAIGNISRALGARGIAVLRFDFTGLGESEGEFSDTSFSSNVADLLAASRHMEREWQAPSILVGHSFGGAAVLRAAGSLEKVKAVATIAAPHDPKHVERLLVSKRDEIERNGIAEVSIGGRSFRIGKEFLDDLESVARDEPVATLGRALLILHSPADRTVGIDNAAKIFQVAKHPKSFISLDDADHLLMEERDSLYAGGMIAAWVDRYL